MFSGVPSGLASPFTTMADTLELKTEKQNAHSSGISSVAFHPDGKSILSGSEDKTLKVWKFEMDGAPGESSNLGSPN